MLNCTDQYSGRFTRTRSVNRATCGAVREPYLYVNAWVDSTRRCAESAEGPTKNEAGTCLGVTLRDRATICSAYGVEKKSFASVPRSFDFPL
jgi:hypothetical protein